MSFLSPIPIKKRYRFYKYKTQIERETDYDL